jgi:hypothetical protein
MAGVISTDINWSNQTITSQTTASRIVYFIDGLIWRPWTETVSRITQEAKPVTATQSAKEVTPPPTGNADPGTFPGQYTYRRELIGQVPGYYVVTRELEQTTWEEYVAP